MKKPIVTMLLSLAVGLGGAAAEMTASIPAATYFSFLSAKDLQTLLTSGELSASGSSLADLPYGSEAPWKSLLIPRMTVPGSTVAQEGLYLFDKPNGDALLKIYNALNQVKSMKGTQYYSLSQKKMETLILDSYRVDSSDGKTPIDDPQFTTIPDSQTALVFQKDNRLGNGVTELLFEKQAEGTLTLTMTNRQALTYLFVPLVAAHDMKMVFIVIPLADKVAVYAGMEVRTARLFGLEHSKDENFRNRLRALAGWLGQRIGTVIR